MKKKFALVTATAITVLLLFVGCGEKKWGRFLN